MPTFSKSILSIGDGLPINITATGTGLQAIHATTFNTGELDEVWLYACNPTVSDVMLNIFSNTGESPSIDFTRHAIFEGVIEAYAGNTLVIPGFTFRGSLPTPTVIYANVSVPSGVNLIGYVNKIR
jgi:hypothetical protein